MIRGRRTRERREIMLKNLEKQIFLKNRRNHLYNLKFRKGILFLSSWIVRGLFFCLFITVLFTHQIVNSSSKEILQSKQIERIEGGKGAKSTLYLRTNNGDYTADISGKRIPPFEEGDTIIIQKNFYNKPVFFTKPSWFICYDLSINIILYTSVFFLTLISAFFNDGLDKSTPAIILSITFINIITILFYFIL